jgi:hypothetical protein
MNGTQKQIEWAEKIIDGVIEKLTAGGLKPERATEFRTLIIKADPNAANWIGDRDFYARESATAIQLVLAQTLKDAGLLPA